MGNSRKVKIVRERFNEVKKIKKKTMQEFCIKARVKYETVRYCLREGAMMPDILDKLAKTIGCDVRYLTGEHSYIYNPELLKLLGLEDHEIFGVDSNGIEIHLYDEGQSDLAYDSAFIAFNKMMGFMHEALYIEVTSDSGEKSKYTFDDYLRDREEVHFYSLHGWENKPIPDWSKLDTNNLDFSTEFEMMVTTFENEMRRYHDNKEKIIQEVKKEASKYGKH